MAVRADLNGIKDAIKSILTDANTTTASPIDLSANLLNSKRVNKILSIHPEMIKPQASFFPLVTCYIEEKPVISQDIAKTQLDAQRRARVEAKIVGSVWNNNFTTVDKDPADVDINYLMENIELIMRGNYNLNGTVQWQRAGGCKYYTTLLSEQTHLRSGILTLECEIYY